MNLSQRKISCLIFFLLAWGLLALLINAKDGRDYSLQHALVDSVVEHGTFAVGLSKNPRLQVGGDTFHYKGQILAAKQPGQAVFGAIPYLAIRTFGVTYDTNYDLTAALVTWGSAALWAALAALVFFILVEHLFPGRYLLATLPPLTWLFATPILPYSGVLHHDTIASSFMLIAFCFLEFAHMSSERARRVLAWAAGLFVTLTLFVSMLPAACVTVITAYGFFRIRGKTVLWFILGLFCGIFPLALYNFYYFGNPFIQANIAGGFSDTFVRFDIPLFLRNLNTYFGSGWLSLLSFSPVTVLAAMGILLSFKRSLHQQEARFYCLALAIAAHIAYICSIETVGHCQYGPRYLLPIMALPMLGITSLLSSNNRFIRYFTYAFLPVTLLYSLGVSILGALYGTMYCAYGSFANSDYWAQMLKSSYPQLPLFGLFW